MSNIQEWNYGGNADIAFGDVKINPLPKLIVIFTFLGVIVITALAITFRKPLMDLIMNPQVILVDSTVNVEVYSDFDPKKFILDNEELLTNIDISNVDTSDLGTFEVIYSSKNSMSAMDQTLTVNVIDRTVPVILLKTDDNSELNIQLKDGQYTAQVTVNDPRVANFDPSEYIDLVLDNYNSLDEISLDWSRKLDFTKVDNLTVVYGATDKSGNLGNTTLNIQVVEQTDAERLEYEKKITDMENELSNLLNSLNNN